MATVTYPDAVEVEPSGQFVYVTSRSGNSLSAYVLDNTTGALTAVGSPVATGAIRMAMAVDPSGRFVYVANQGSNNVSAFAIDGTTGALTPVVGSPFAAGSMTRAIAVDPTGRFAYVVNRTSNNLSAYTIDGTTGALTPVAGCPFAGLSDPRGVTVDPSGRFVYAVNNGANSVSALAINGTTGALTPVAGSPLPVEPIDTGMVLPHKGTPIHCGLKPVWSRMPRCSDPDDQKFLELAAASQAQGLVSQDRALLKLRRRCAPLFRVMTPDEAVRWLAAADLRRAPAAGT